MNLPKHLDDPIATYHAQLQGARATAQQVAARLKQQVQDGALTWPQAQEQLRAWWAGGVDALLAGYRAAAEAHRLAQQRALEPEQRAGEFRMRAPDFEEVAERAAARRLAHISPYAAARAGAPFPDLPAALDLNEFLAPFTLRPA